MTTNYIDEAIRQHKLPASFSTIVSQYYRPLAQQVAQRTALLNKERPLVFGIQGTQGSGKSTCAAFLQDILRHDYDLTSLVLSIDDFYYSRAKRTDLAQQTHPLLMTRGVPGTHDVDLGLQIFKALQSQQPGQALRAPVFNKAIDDLHPNAQWLEINLPVDIVIFEGWCVGIPPQEKADLAPALNRLEAEEDKDGVWRGYVNDQLVGAYKDWFDKMDFFAVLQAPSFECVFEWRSLQEQKLIDALKAGAGASTNGHKTMNAEELLRFISHYERLTRHGLKVLPQKADCVLALGEDHNIISMT